MRITPQFFNHSLNCNAYFGETEGRLRPIYHLQFSPLVLHNQKVANTRHLFFKEANFTSKSMCQASCAGEGNKATMQPSPNIIHPVKPSLTHFPD